MEAYLYFEPIFWSRHIMPWKIAFCREKSRALWRRNAGYSCGNITDYWL